MPPPGVRTLGGELPGSTRSGSAVMEQEYIQPIVLALLFGTASYAFAKRLKVPPILFYLVIGMASGPGWLRIIEPSRLGEALPMLIEVGVAIILFEGGLSLPAEGWRAAPTAIRRILIFVPALTGVGGVLLAHFITDLSWKISLIFGALIVVTGPTVIGPLLKSVRLPQGLEVVLRYEAIWGDCIGVLLSGLALELVPIEEFSGLSRLGFSFALRVLAGVGVGTVTGLFLSRVLLPRIIKLGDPALPGMVAFTAALAVFWGSNLVSAYSGPLAAAVAGFTLSLLKEPTLPEIRHFKDQVATLFISMIFVLLSASINPLDTLPVLGPVLMVALLMGAVVRPLSVLLALPGTRLTLRERAYIGLIGPRGIVAIASASYASFAVSARDQEMFVLVTLTFAIIFVSGGVATLLSRPLAQLLKLSITPYQSGILLVGVNALSLAIADFARKHAPVRFVDTNESACRLARQEGFEALSKSALDDDVYNAAMEEGFRRALVMTPNEALNVLILRHSQAHFGASHAFRVLVKPSDTAQGTDPFSRRSIAFSPAFHLQEAIAALEAGAARISVFSGDELQDLHGVALLAVRAGGVRIVRAGEDPRGQEVLCWIPAGLGSPAAVGILAGGASRFRSR